MFSACLSLSMPLCQKEQHQCLIAISSKVLRQFSSLLYFGIQSEICREVEQLIPKLCLKVVFRCYLFTHGHKIESFLLRKDSAEMALWILLMAQEFSSARKNIIYMGSEVQSKVQDTAFAIQKFGAYFILSVLTHCHENVTREQSRCLSREQ